jgi:hypothetical protein
MEKRLLNFDDILAGEKSTIIDTRNIYKNVSSEIPLALNVLLQLNYFTGNCPDIKTDEGQFHSYCWHQYVNSPYSFRGCHILWECGYYLESAIIFRSLIERFIQIRYLHKNKNLVGQVWSSIKPESVKVKKITFKVMFDHIAPGYYEVWYGKILSGFAHSKIAANIFRIKRSSPTNGKVIMMPSFDERGSMVINNVISLLFGYLKFFPIFFPLGFKTVPDDLLKEYNESVSYFQKFMDGFKNKFPKSLLWFKYMDKIINP